MGREEKSLNLIKGKVLIRVSRVEKFPEINKRACPSIRHLRVLTAFSFSPGFVN